MLLIDQYKHIKKRADFFTALDKAIQETLDLLRIAPGDKTLESILRQLEMIRKWTANGREPTKEERRKTNIGLRLSREFNPAPTDRLQDWGELASEVESYFEDWLDDQTFQTVDEDDLSDFPADDDDDA